MKLLLIFFTSLLLVGYIESRELQLWNIVGVEKKITDKWNADLLFSTRTIVQPEPTQVFLYYLKGDINKQINKSWSLSLGYRHYWIKDLIKNKWLNEENPIFSITRTGNYKRVTWSDRNRVEYRSLQRTFLYRNQLQLAIPLHCNFLKLLPFISEEIFFNKNGFSQNRVGAGLQTEDTSFYMRIFYFIKSDRIGKHWVNSNVVDLTFTLNF